MKDGSIRHKIDGDCLSQNWQKSDIVSYEMELGKEAADLDSRIKVLSTVKIGKSPDLYKVVTELNKTLKYKDVMFGLALDEQDENKMIFTIYKT